MRERLGKRGSNAFGAIHELPLREALPDGWSTRSLENVSKVIMGQSPPSSTYNTDGNGIPFFQGKGEFRSLYPNVRKWCSKPSKIAQKNDVLISVRAPVGPTNLAPSECCIGRGLAAIHPSEGIPTKYILFYLRSIESEIEALGTGTTFKAISGPILRSLSIPIAPLNQQISIVAEIEKQFSRLDEAVAALNRIKANLKRYKASVLKAAVEGKLTEEWRKERPDVEPASELLERILVERRRKWKEVYPKKKYKEPFKPNAISFGLPEKWTLATIQQLAELVQYGSSSKTSEDPTGIPVLRMGNIFEGELYFNKLKYLPKDHTEFPDLLLIKNDLLFNRTNSPELVGKTAVYKNKPKPCSFASYLIRVRLNNDIDPNFINYYLNSSYGRMWIKSVVSQQVGQANVNGTKLQAVTVPFPPYEVQQNIIAEVENKLSIINGIENHVDITLKRAERLRQSILKKAFSGKLVPPVAKDDAIKKYHRSMYRRIY